MLTAPLDGPELATEARQLGDSKRSSFRGLPLVTDLRLCFVLPVWRQVPNSHS